MNAPATMYTGPLGSTIHVLRADAGTIAELAAIDWNRRFRRVCLDPVRGIITLMAPSFPHEDLARILDDIVDVAGSAIAGVSKGIRSTRLRGQGEPPGTGMEPDCAFYVGERARGFYAARADGDAALDAFVERIAPDLASRPIWWWRSRSRTPMKARPNATARWGCGSCGGCTGARVRGSCGRTFSLWVPGARCAGLALRRCWKG